MPDAFALPDDIRAMLDEVGVFQYGIVPVDELVFSEDVRKMCEVNTCRKYNTTWACPPAVGTVDECRERCRRFKRMLLFSVKYDLEDSFDYEGMTEGMAKFKETSRALAERVKLRLEAHFVLSNEGCGLCSACTYPDAPCRFPDRVQGSLEGYGFFVNQLAKSAGIHYINGANTVTYFGAVLFDDFQAPRGDAAGR